MKRRRWTAQEIQMLQDRYPEEGPNELAQEMGRSADSVSSFAHRCGLRTTTMAGAAGSHTLRTPNLSGHHVMRPMRTS